MERATLRPLPLGPPEEAINLHKPQLFRFPKPPGPYQLVKIPVIERPRYIETYIDTRVAVTEELLKYQASFAFINSVVGVEVVVVKNPGDYAVSGYLLFRQKPDKTATTTTRHYVFLADGTVDYRSERGGQTERTKKFATWDQAAKHTLLFTAIVIKRIFEPLRQEAQLVRAECDLRGIPFGRIR